MRLLLLLNDVKPPIVGVAPTVTINPSIVGSPIVGVTLTDSAGAADGTPTPAAVLGQWQISANGTTGWTNLVTGNTYTIPLGDATKYYRILVTWRNATDPDAIGTSAVVGPVTNPVSPPSGVSPPVIT